MFICRLFHRDSPAEQVDWRLLANGTITLGRDPSADWPMDDGEGLLSRIHCSLAVEDGRLFLRDNSSNGTFLGDGERAPRGEALEIHAREIIRLGALSLKVDHASAEPAADLATRLHLPLSTAPVELPTDWTDARSAAPAPHRDASLIEAFCEGAHLDASALSGEDPVELMRRLGAVYQQTVIGLSTLMVERSRLKGEYQLDRTTIGAANNNPFKWAPSRRLAQDLLCHRNDGFLADAAAVRASFEDLGEHMAAVARGANAAAAFVLDALSPAAIEAEARAEGFSLKTRTASRWDIHNRRHAALSAPPDRGESAAARAFNDAYRAPNEAGGG